MNNDLHTVQRNFCQWLRDPTTKTPYCLPKARMAIYVEVVLENIKTFIDVAYPLSKKLIKKKEWQQMLLQFMAHHQAQSPFFYEIANEFREFLLTDIAKGTLPFLTKYPQLNELMHYEYLEMVIHRDSAKWLGGKGVTLQAALQSPKKYHLRLRTQVWLMVYQYPVYHLTSNSSRACIKNLTLQPSAILVFKDKNEYITWQVVDAISAVIIETIFAQLEQQTTLNIFNIIEDEQMLNLSLTSKQLKQHVISVLNMLDKHHLIKTKKSIY